ncbi:MAG: CopG family transcriptional regulator, partial [Candidatus Heimdallarchaeota archaeon]|nr:CopG family transcriptional regulator [Candidatus Heimdallarchaeota archaeon]
MSTTMSVKIPEDLRKKMRELNDQVEWSKEIREYIMRRIREIESKTR